MAGSEPTRPELQAVDVQRQHPAGAGGDLGVLRRGPIGEGGPLPEGAAAAVGENRTVGSQSGKRLQRVDEPPLVHTVFNVPTLTCT